MEYRSIEEVENIFKLSLAKFSENQRITILKALVLAKEAHDGQFRDEGPEYIIHPIRVATLLINDLKIEDEEVIIAALLHDAAEDTDLTIDSISDVFGQRVAMIVKALTRDKNEQTKYEKFVETMKTDIDIRAIKACDWLDNMNSWAFIAQNSPAREKLPRWIQEAETMYIPLAETVNSNLAEKMEDTLNKVKALQILS